MPYIAVDETLVMGLFLNEIQYFKHFLKVLNLARSYYKNNIVYG